LGLVATLEPTPLTCTNGVCSAEFSAFCLQKRRAAPMPDTAYAVAPGTRLTLRLTAADGQTHDIDAVPHVSVTSERIFASVRISLPEAELRRLGGAGAAVAVGQLASVVPVASADNPLAAAEIAQVTGPMRKLAAAVLESGGEGAVTARIANQLVNANYPADYQAKVDVDALWTKAVGAKPGPDAAPGVKRAAAALAHCAVNYGGNSGLVSECMGEVHDTLMSETTERVWKGLAAGS
jgi:hypothetical protein